MSWEGKSALITGASSGIGRAIALDLGRRGAELILLGRSTERLEETAFATESKCESHAVDLADDDALDAFLQHFEGTHDRLDALIHSAGVVTLGTLETAPIEALDFNLRTNLRAPVVLTRALLPLVLSARGQIVFVNSGAGLNARAEWGHYAASKFGLKAIADSLREEIKPRGVRVMTAFPGRTATPMQAEVHRLEGREYVADAFIQPESVAEMIGAALSLPRTADVIEINIRSA